MYGGFCAFKFVVGGATMQRDGNGAFTEERLVNHLHALAGCSNFQAIFELVPKEVNPRDEHKSWEGYEYYEGRGSYAYVFRCRKKDPQAASERETDGPAALGRTYSNSELLAVKVILKAPGQAPRPQFSQDSAHGGGSVNREIFMLENMTCLFRTRRGAVQLRAQWSTADAFIIVMTLITDGKSLKKVIEDDLLSAPHSERNQVASQFVRDIGLNLFYMHELGLIFGDLSLGNAMMATSKSGKKYFTLVDYGGTAYDGEKMQSGRGTIMAPEVSSSLGDPSVHYTTKVDCYVLGSLLYSIMTGREMSTNYLGDVADEVRGTCQSELNALNEEEKKIGQRPGYLAKSSPFDLILKLLEKDAEKRWTMKQALGHKWIKQNASTRVDNLRLFLNHNQLFRHPKDPSLTYPRYLWEEMAGRATRKTVTLDVKPTDTITDIRKKIQFLVGIDSPKLKPKKTQSESAELADPDPAVQRLFFNGSEVKSRTLEECGILCGKQEFVVELPQRIMPPVLVDCISLYMGVSIQKIKEDTKDLKKVQQFRKLFLERDLGKLADKVICKIKAKADEAKHSEQRTRGYEDYLYFYLANYMCLKIDQVLDEKEESAVAGFKQDADALLSALRYLTRDRDDPSDETGDHERDLEMYLLKNGGGGSLLEKSPSPLPSLASTPVLSRTLSRASITSSASKVDALHDLATLQMESSEDATTTMDSTGEQANAESPWLDLPGSIQRVKDDRDRELDHVMERIRKLDKEMNDHARESRRIDAPFGKARSQLHQAALRLGESKRGIEKEIREELLAITLDPLGGEGWEKVTSKPKPKLKAKAKGNQKYGYDPSASGQVLMLELLEKLQNEIEDLKIQQEKVAIDWERWCRSPAPQAVTMGVSGGGRSGGVSGGAREDKSARGTGRAGGQRGGSGAARGGGDKGRPAARGGKHM